MPNETLHVFKIDEVLLNHPVLQVAHPHSNRHLDFCLRLSGSNNAELES